MVRPSGRVRLKAPSLTRPVGDGHAKAGYLLFGGDDQSLQFLLLKETDCGLPVPGRGNDNYPLSKYDARSHID